MGFLDLFSDIFENGGTGKQSEALKSEVWKVENKNISFHNNPYCEIEHMGRNFYRSSYACPYCRGVMLKTVFPPEGEYIIKTTKGGEYLKRVFTCPKCKIFIAPIPGSKLNSGTIIEKKYSSSNEYNNRVNDMDSLATIKGRLDL